jgi:HCOMODA/2-hydroxy-3-carboxy-muconic semialdehyde decarboxylase
MKIPRGVIACVRTSIMLAALLYDSGTRITAQQAPADPDAARIADIVTASHILENQNVLDSFGHVTARSVKNPTHMFIPRAMPPALVSAKDIVEVDITDCKPIDPNAPRLNGERFIHCEIYKARPEVQSVIHDHAEAVIPFSLTSVPLRPVVAQAGFLPPVTPVFEVRTVNGKDPVRGMLVINAKLGDALAAQLGGNPVILMRGHGETVVGGSVREATVRALYSVIDARVEAAALALSPNIVPMDEAELKFNATENFDADRPWENFKQKLPPDRQ